MNFLEYEAVIWDLDGTIIDTGDLHFKTWQIAFSENGIPFSYQRFLAAFGQNNSITVQYNLPGASKQEVERIVRHKEELFRELVKTELRIFPQARNLLNEIKNHSIPQALATSSPEKNIGAVFAGSDLSGFFGVVISGDSLPPKPDPAIFLLAADKLGVPASACLVIEDSVMGVRAGKAAGMEVAVFTHSFSADELADADWIIE